MELNIKIIETNPSIKNLKVNPTDIISLSFIAENIVLKIDNIEKNIANKENILLMLREYSPNEKILFNLIRNDSTIIGTGKFTPLTGAKWYKMFDLISITENNINKNSSKNLLRRSSSNNNDSLINSNIKIKFETQVNLTKSKSKSKLNIQKINNSNNKNKSNLTNLEKNNSLIASNIASYNQLQLNKNINSYNDTPGTKSPRYNNILIRAKSNNTNNDSSRDNSLKENNVLRASDFDKDKEKKKSDSRRTTSGKKFLFQTKKYKTIYGFNKSQGVNKNRSTEKSLDNNNIVPENVRGKMSKEIEEKILDKNFQDIIKCDEILRGKDMESNINTINKESNKNINIKNIENNNNNINDKKPSTNKKVSQNNTENKNYKDNKAKSNTINYVSNSKNNKNNKNMKNINNNNIINEINNAELNSKNLKTEFNNIIPNSPMNSALSSNRMFNSNNDMELSGDNFSDSFSGYENLSKILALDDYKITYDIENENITKYENAKNDFILFYNKDYISSINEEMLTLELQLMIDKILEMQNIYKRQKIIIERNFGKFEKKLFFYQKINILFNKKINKLMHEKSKNKYKEEMNDLYYNNRKIIFYRNKNIFKTNEQSLWNNITLYVNEKQANNKINNKKKQFSNLFLLICNKNLNNLNALSKKYVSDFIEKEKEKEKKEKEK